MQPGQSGALDKNCLYLAEKHGARMFAETQVVDVIPLDGVADGGASYEVRTVKSTAWLRWQPRRFTCRSVVFAASALGAMDLLFRLRRKGSLPAVSQQPGRRTALVLGGCAMAGSPAEGVVDARNRVFAYRNLYICDGSMIAANRGVNPSLTMRAHGTGDEFRSSRHPPG